MASSSSSSEAMSAPPTSTLPDVGVASPPSRWSSVDFPDPDGPDGDELAMVGHEVDVAHCVDGRLVIDVALAEPPGFDGDLLALGRPGFCAGFVRGCKDVREPLGSICDYDHHHGTGQDVFGWSIQRVGL